MKADVIYWEIRNKFWEAVIIALHLGKAILKQQYAKNSG